MITNVALAAVATLVHYAAASGAGTFSNMNGEYVISKTMGAPADKTFPTNFSDFPGGVEYFEVYHGPIKTVYSEVNWHPMTNPIPEEIVKRFNGKVMAIVGLEMDQVRRTPEGDVPVPISIAYNHHHDTAVVGKGAHLEKVDMHDPRMRQYGRNYVMLSGHKAWIPVEDTPSVSGVATSAMFSDGNGGEYRKTFHAYAPPFAQLVESPYELSGSAMQIDTWNREKMNLTGSPFVTGPVPRHNLAPLSGPDAKYSGLLECPLTTRIQKIFNPGSEGFNDSYIAQVVPCTHYINTSETCFATAAELPGLANTSLTTKTVHKTDVPSGCTVLVRRDGKEAQVTFNSDAESKSTCSAGAKSEIAGAIQSLVNLGLSLSGSKSNVTITMTGPATTWFGVGFGATLMSDLPYAIIVDGTGNVQERKLADHAAGNALAASVDVLSNAVSEGQRTVVLSRSLKGATKDHYTFSATALSIPIINAIGTGPAFAYHKSSTAATLSLWPSDGQSSACVCVQPAAPFGQGSGFIKYLETGQTLGFPPNRCGAQQNKDLLDQGNPTCDLRTYAGGLETCHDGWKLLDADQEIPWADQPIEYYKKYRVYFQEYKPSFHKQIQRHDWGIACDGDHAEYDVPQCSPGTPTAKCKHTISGAWIPIPASRKDVYLMAVHHHCHAPTCLRMEMWNNDTGKLLCASEPVYGGTNKIDLPAYDEPGYIATPPCLWGSLEHGLEPPPLISGVTIRVVAITNSTYGHHGEMALPEVSTVQGPLPMASMRQGAPEMLV